MVSLLRFWSESLAVTQSNIQSLSRQRTTTGLDLVGVDCEDDRVGIMS